MSQWVAALAVVAATSVGCSTPTSGDSAPPRPTDGSPTVATAGAEDRTVHLPGPVGERTVSVFHPQSAGPGAPLVVVLHGSGGDGAAIRDDVGIDELARREGFVVAYPDALDSRWNAGICCRERNMPDVDDVAFLHDMRAQLVAEDQVDPHRVYAMGMSNGGMLSYAWACDRPGDIVGVGVVAATLVTDCPDPSPVTVVAVHGTADTVVPLDGRVRGVRNIPSVDEALTPFRAADGCPPDPTVDVIGPATVSIWSCAAGREVVRAVITGARHAWPDAGRAGQRGVDDPRDATEFIWHHLAGAEAP